MTASLLPVRPTPRPGEPLSSYAVRLADANGLARGRVLPAWRHDIDVPMRELSTIGSLAALDPGAATQLTMDRYPLAVRGHGPQRRHGWRLHHAVAWVCPSCTVSTGHRELLWQTALVPVCLRCSCYLIRAGSPRIVVPAPPRVLEIVQGLAELAEASVADRGARQVLYRRRRRCQYLATTIGQDSFDLGGDLPPVDLAAARAWGAYPCPDPATVAALLVLTSPRRGRGSRPAHLRCGQSSVFTDADRDRLDWFLTRLRQNVDHDDLRTDHVPSMLPPPQGEAERKPGAWLSLTRAATALHMLISQANGHTETPGAAMTALGVVGIPSCILIDGIHAGQGLREQDGDLLTTALQQLLTAGLVDYQRRRDTLRPVTRLPGTTLRRLPTTLATIPEFRRLALAWIWTRFTHGPMRSSPWPTTPDRDVATFDKRLDPETRLLLHEMGQQLLADTDLLQIPATQATWAGIARRYG
ncbi:TniQ family protein [uncultured Ornithinimicrobium sp.]|uniref:TniQ family protein n=1 Tax=uncultured Ornithinimicrobium sp. TaxID=259307 RepID=UPI002593007D|nr:TniQ family protein [uncultured Ornithinimicrobium sp.]